MSKEIPVDVRQAIKTIHEDSAGQEERLKASKVIDDWTGSGEGPGFIERNQAVKQAFADVPGSGDLASPVKGTTRSGSSTAPIPPTVQGTGIPTQKKHPRDLRG